MQMLKTVIEPLIEEALNEVGVVNDHWKNMLAPSRELEQGDISLPCSSSREGASMFFQ
jgi:hypothetical protein